MHTALRATVVGFGMLMATSAMTHAQAATIVETAQGNENLSTLVTAVSEAGLVETLSGEGPFTVFAPTNEAFEALPEGALDGLLADTEALSGVLTYHVVSGEVMAEALVGMINDDGGAHEVTTMNGATFSAALEGENVVITDGQGNTATVVTADVEASNGVVHVIDGVLQP